MYLRLSDEREAPIERQRADCLKLIEARGWDLTGEHVDNLSAFKEGVIRPDYVALCDRIEAGDVDVVVCYHRDRLWRQVTDQAAFVRTARRGGLQLVASVSEGDMDPSSPTDKFVATILAAHAEMSSEDTRRRVRRAALAAAEAGRPSGGGYRAFGYERDGITVIESEAALIREAVTDLLDGGTLVGVVNRWNAAGVLSSAGNRWQRAALRNLLLRPRIAGIRQHHGREIREAVWPALVPEEEWRALRKLLYSHRGDLRPAIALLAGIARCGKCGAPLGTEPPRLRSDGRRTVGRLYACRPRADGGCRSLAIRANRLDEVVERRMFDAVDSGLLEDALRRREQALAAQGTQSVLDTLDANKAALEELRHDYYVRKTMTRSTFLQIEDQLMAQIATGERIIDAAETGVDPRIFGPRFKRVWEGKTEDLRWRRKVIRVVFERIEVLPSPTRGGRIFDQSRVVTVLI
jgi:site-specific DNA recombinase